jgi:predicted molibdopterin-dependent oxidoreductase YjgC
MIPARAAAGAATGGEVGAGLVCLAGESGGDSELVAKLNNLSFLGVITTNWPDQLADRARVLLPRASWLEAGGTYTAADGSVSRETIKVLEPPPGIKPGIVTLAEIAGRMGVA